MTLAEKVDAAKCYTCIPDNIKLAVLIYLLQQIWESGIVVNTSGVMGDTCSSTAVQNDATALAANTDRKIAKIRNLSTDPLYVQLGAGCTTTIGQYWEYLPGADVQDDWASSYYVDITNYTGIVTVAGNNLRYIATEIYQA